MEATSAVRLEYGYRQLATARACRRLVGLIARVGTVSPEVIKPAISRIDADWQVAGAGDSKALMADVRTVLVDALDAHPRHLSQEACHTVHQQLDVLLPTVTRALRALMDEEALPSLDDSDDQPHAPGSH